VKHPPRHNDGEGLFCGYVDFNASSSAGGLVFDHVVLDGRHAAASTVEDWYRLEQRRRRQRSRYRPQCPAFGCLEIPQLRASDGTAHDILRDGNDPRHIGRRNRIVGDVGLGLYYIARHSQHMAIDGEQGRHSLCIFPAVDHLPDDLGSTGAARNDLTGGNKHE